MSYLRNQARGRAAAATLGDLEVRASLACNLARTRLGHAGEDLDRLFGRVALADNEHADPLTGLLRLRIEDRYNMACPLHYE